MAGGIGITRRAGPYCGSPKFTSCAGTQIFQRALQFSQSSSRYRSCTVGRHSILSREPGSHGRPWGHSTPCSPWTGPWVGPPPGPSGRRMSESMLLGGCKEKAQWGHV